MDGEVDSDLLLVLLDVVDHAVALVVGDVNPAPDGLAVHPRLGDELHRLGDVQVELVLVLYTVHFSGIHRDEAFNVPFS